MKISRVSFVSLSHIFVLTLMYVPIREEVNKKALFCVSYWREPERRLQSRVCASKV